MVPEADVVSGVPQAAGWFVVNARDAPWFHNELGGYCGFEGRDDAAFDDLGINLNMLPPGKPMAMYHEEPGQEAFLVLSGECLLIVEGEERPLRTWDFFHCPPKTKHVILGAGEGPALVLAVGARKLPRRRDGGAPRRGRREGGRLACRGLRRVLETERRVTARPFLARDQGFAIHPRYRVGASAANAVTCCSSPAVSRSTRPLLSPTARTGRLGTRSWRAVAASGFRTSPTTTSPR